MGKKRKKGEISEDDTIKTMSRYGASTIITLLQEVAQSADVKIDWKTIVKRSSTGISNPREYQLLWRHLAYREPLLEEIDGAEPMDDDSDLEFELETDPTISAEVTSQAQECVKVLMSTRLSSVSGPPINSEVKVHTVLETSNGPVPNTAPSDKEDATPASVKNTTVLLHKQTTPTHVSLHNQTASTGPPAKGFERKVAAGVGSSDRNGRTEGFEGNDTAAASSAAKKKRKMWTEEEDAELIAGVQRCGEGNWVTVLKEYFMHDRTASQLSQRWSILKKRRLSTSNTNRSCNSISLDKSEVLDAARLALKNALGKPMARSYSMTNAGFTQSITPPKIINPFSPIIPGALHRPPPLQKLNLPLETERTVLDVSDILDKTPNQAEPEKGNMTPSGKPRSTPKGPPASVKTETKRKVQDASDLLQETRVQAAPKKGNATPSSKPQSTPKWPPASVKPETKRTVQEALDIPQETPNQAVPEKGNVTPSSKPQSTPKRPPASLKPETGFTQSITPPKIINPLSPIIPGALHRPPPLQKPNLPLETERTVLEVSDILDKTPNQAEPEKGNMTPSGKPRSTPKRPPASVKTETKRKVQEASDLPQETRFQAAPKKGNVTPSSKPQSTPKRPPASVKPETKRTVQEALDIPQETLNQAVPEKGNVTPSSKPQCTPKRPPASLKPETKRAVQDASDIPQETPNQAILERGNVTPSSNSQSTPKHTLAFVKPENKKAVQEALDIPQETPKQAAPEKGKVTPSSKPPSTQKWPPASVRPPISTTSSLIKAAAFAAGGRIVAPSAVASLMQAAQSKNVVRIRAGGSQLTSTVSRGRQQTNAHPPLPFMMPSPPENSFMMSNRSRVQRHQKQDSSNIAMKISAAGAQQSSSSPGHAEKMSGKETSAIPSNGDSGLAARVAEGADSMKSGVRNQDRKSSLEAGEKDSRTEKDVNVTV